MRLMEDWEEEEDEKGRWEEDRLGKKGGEERRSEEKESIV